MRLKTFFLVLIHTSIIILALIGLLLLSIYFFKYDTEIRSFESMQEQCLTGLKLFELQNNSYFINEDQNFFITEYQQIDKIFSISKFNKKEKLKNDIYDIIRNNKNKGIKKIKLSGNNYLLCFCKDRKTNTLAFMLKSQDEIFHEIYNIERRGILLITITFQIFIAINILFFYFYRK